MALYLIHGRWDRAVRQELLQNLLREIGDSNGANLAFPENSLHLLPSLRDRPVGEDITLSVWESGEVWVVAVRVQGDRPVDEVHCRSESICASYTGWEYVRSR